MPPVQSGAAYKGTQSFDGKWAGTGFYPEETLKYFEFYFKGKSAEHNFDFDPPSRRKAKAAERAQRRKSASANGTGAAGAANSGP